jgi:hypothetical protein
LKFIVENGQFQKDGRPLRPEIVRFQKCFYIRNQDEKKERKEKDMDNRKNDYQRGEIYG